MLPDEVRKAVDIIGQPDATGNEIDEADRVIRAHLLAREAEVERLNAAWDSAYKQAMQNGQAAQDQRARAERAEALLREAAALLHPDTDEYKRITAHLSENSRG